MAANKKPDVTFIPNFLETKVMRRLVDVPPGAAPLGCWYLEERAPTEGDAGS
jgi:hypothetical protein